MDITYNRANAINHDGEHYQNFAIFGGALASIAKEANKKKFADKEIEAIQIKYPAADNSADQKKLVMQLTKESALVLEKRNFASGKLRTELTGKIRAYDEYIDYSKSVLNALIKAEKEMASVTQEVQNAEGIVADVSGAALTDTGVAATDTQKAKSKLLLYAGIGLAVVAVIVVIIKKRNQ